MTSIRHEDMMNLPEIRDNVKFTTNMSTSGSGVYLAFYQSKTDTDGNEVSSSHIMLFPEQLDKIMEWLPKAYERAKKSDSFIKAVKAGHLT